MEGSVYLKARQEWDERYADLVLGNQLADRLHTRTYADAIIEAVTRPSMRFVMDGRNAENNAR